MRPRMIAQAAPVCAQAVAAALGFTASTGAAVATGAVVKL